MSNPTFPTLTEGQDSSLYNVELEDPAMKTDMEGGYVISRAKHTRAPRRTYKTGFTMIQNADKALLDNFYDLVKGGSVIFDWTDPVTSAVKQVRFLDKISFKYQGRGGNHYWDVGITLQQA